jgi:hypothetical protein
MKKKAQFDFVWIFALVAGGAILLLAIIGAMKLGDTERYQSDTEVAKSLSTIIDKLQTGFSEGEYGTVNFRQDARINNLCLDDGDFGKNELSISTHSDVGDEWNLAGGATSIHNKYIFSEDQVTGKDFYVFSLPFDFPYKVTDISILVSETYCFTGLSESLTEELSRTPYPFIELENCTATSKKVCFGPANDCDIKVYGTCTSGCDSLYDEGKVVNRGAEMRYVGNLMYAAIFSDKGIYDCNVERLLHRTGRIAEELMQKADLMDARQCNTNLKTDLFVWSGETLNASVSELISLNSMSKVLDKKNDREICGIWD